MSTTSFESTFPFPQPLAFCRSYSPDWAAFCGGALTALYRQRLPDVVIMFLVILAISVPSFVVAALGQLSLVIMNTTLGFSLLPIAGWGDAVPHAGTLNRARTRDDGVSDPV